MLLTGNPATTSGFTKGRLGASTTYFWFLVEAKHSKTQLPGGPTPRDEHGDTATVSNTL